jgi:hypothetical protein
LIILTNIYFSYPLERFILINIDSKWERTMRTLIDTNIIIPLEDDSILESRFADFCREASKTSDLIIHPASKLDIDRDKNEERKKIILSKISKYQELEKPPEPKKDFLTELSVDKDPNNIVDAKLLYSVFRNSVNFLVTEDKGIHKKAIKLSINERVLTIDQALTLFSRLVDREIPTHTLINHIPAYNLNITDPFFDSLRDDYGINKFNIWFEKICREGRNCWALIDDKILAVNIYKEESEPDSKDIPAPSLKLSTFKVSEMVAGRKIGELMLKLSFNYAIRNNLKSIYLTLYPVKQQPLISLLEDFGFKNIGKKGEEVMMMKTMYPPSDISKEIDSLRYAIDYYPFYQDHGSVDKFIVPIVPEYHDKLFPDCLSRQTRMEEFSEICPEGNTIKKAYICNSKIRKIKTGDVLLFYRSRDRKEVTSIGIVENIEISDNPSTIATIVSNRTVYSIDEISELASKNALIIIFRHMSNFNSPISSYTLQETCEVQGPIQSIRQVSDEDYHKIIREGN